MSKQKINLIYFHDQTCTNGNFGDELSVFITTSLMNKEKYELVCNQKDVPENIMCIGSYIHCAKNDSFIFGSGVRTDNHHCHTYENLKVCAVRGPLTKEFLEKRGIRVGDVFGDPALLLPKFYEPIIHFSLQHKIGVVPHKSNYNKYFTILSGEATHKYSFVFHLICPTDKWSKVIDDLCSCKAILSSSLHGLICADAYEIPNLWIDEYEIPEGDFKFRDYFESQNREYMKICSLNEFREELLYKDGNQIDLERLINSFPFK